jgi:hypothetical protein
MVCGAAALKLHVVPSATITQPSLGERSGCCLKAKHLKVLASEPGALNQHKAVYVPMGRVVIVDGGNELNLFAKPLFKLKHGVNGDFGEVEVFVAVFTAWGGA